MSLNKFRKALFTVLSVVTISAAAILPNTTAVTAEAATTSTLTSYSHYLEEEQYNTTWIYPQNEFDAAYYAQQNPDLAAAFGIANPAALSDAEQTTLYNHYVSSGAAEHRKARMNRASIATPSTFDAQAYADHNPDLAAAYGNDTAKLLNHYLTVGCAEGRQGYFLDDKTTAKDKIFQVARSITNDSMTDRQKAEAVEHWLVDHVQYDRSNYYRGTIPEEDYAIEGPMLYGQAVCEGYSEAFCYFMKVLNIPCLIESSSSHAWNKVKLGDTWYYVDVTWADGYYTNGRTFFNSRYSFTTDGTFGGEPSHRMIREFGYHDMGLVIWG